MTSLNNFMTLTRITIIFASDLLLSEPHDIEPWIQSLIEQAAEDDDLFVSKTSGDALRICQKFPGDS